jgi:hypothetical protein
MKEISDLSESSSVEKPLKTHIIDFNGEGTSVRS